MRRVDRAIEYVRASLWIAPGVGVAVAVACGLGTVAIDHTTDTGLGFTGGAEGARSVLSTIAAAMITFTGLVFSITIVALQLASGQFSPRVMRTFLRDRTSKLALATFVATFSYAFTVLRATRADSVPAISVTISIVLVFVSVGVFIHYINHTAHAIRASTVIEAVAAETRDSLERNYPAELEDPALGPSLPAGGAPAVMTNRGEPGVVTGFDLESIVDRASAAGGVVVLRAGVGDFVPRDAPLVEVHAAAAEDCDIAACVSIGQERTMQQDTAFGFRQLVDLAAKALSPGINDPTTAVQAIDQIHDLLRRLATRPIPPGQATDDDGIVRLVYPTLDWDDFVSLALDEIRIYGADSLQIHRRLHALLDDLSTVVAPDRQPVLGEQAQLLAAAAERELPEALKENPPGHSPAEGLGRGWPS